MRNLYVFLLTLISIQSFPQSMRIAGNVQDTLSKSPAQYAVVMSIKLNDSTLVAFTRTNEKGFFELNNLPIDTYQVVISRPGFGDQNFIALGSNTYTNFDFGKIILPPKSVDMKEVIIYAYKDPVYFKGDTLIYTADSFKVKQNATVEDLLKKLPGIKVDAAGKITSQGKKIDKVLVDGDEFFGSDPTIATRNLGANAVESVQVYDDNNGSGTDNTETQKIMNLKLKEDAKKGYFGKVSGASDLKQFYEGEFLANKFKGKQKVSVFAMTSNTPKSTFNWEDAYKYGLSNEYDTGEDEESFSYSNNQNNGIPQTLKSGFYYTDKISAKTKLSCNYTFQNNLLEAYSEKSAQYFLSDTTYKTFNRYHSRQINEGHSINLGITQKIDSLTELEILPKLVINKTEMNSTDNTDFITSSDQTTRNTNVINSNTNNNQELSGKVKLKRNFKKRDREFNLSYNYGKNDNDQNGFLNSDNIFFTGNNLNDTINQRKTKTNKSIAHSASAVFTEPLNAKIKLEVSYDYFFNKGLQDKKTLDFMGGVYTSENKALSNNFENVKTTNRVGLKFIYEVKKLRWSTGTRLRQVNISNNNLITLQKITQVVPNILPFSSLRYKFNDNKLINISYTTNSAQPDLNQLQPVPDNTNPNQIKLGNPNLKPSYSHNADINFNFFKPISSQYIWSGMHFTLNNNDIATVISYDNIGRTIYEPKNINGNYNGYFYSGGQFPLFGKKFSLNPNLNANLSRNNSYINNEKNTTTTTGISGTLNIEVQREKYEFTVGGNVNYSNPVSTLNNQSNKPYSSQQYTYRFKIRLPKNFSIESDGEYNIYSRRTNGYNINNFIVNASINKTFLKTENLVVSINGNDLLNQNISNSRSVNFNVITDTKTNIIKRYILLRVVLKFNNNKTKEEDEF